MRIVITGATGFIGRALCERLRVDHEIIALSRDAGRAVGSLGDLARVVQWDGRTAGDWVSQADGAAAIINLAGENVASGRWTRTRKERILRSRIDSSGAVVEAIGKMRSRPKVVIQASATGYYRSGGDEELDEGSEAGSGFLADVCRRWESSAEDISALGVRSVVTRMGVVLGTGGGALVRLLRPFRFYLGGHVGSGRQWFAWISLEDVTAAVRFLVENEDLRGVFNLTSPEPVTMREFCRVLGGVIGRPAWTAVPGFVLRAALGQMADEMLLRGQKVLPRRLLEAGFEFKYPQLEHALTAILSRKETK
jgi:uncharacterized protein (TIGR01777 family)